MGYATESRRLAEESLPYKIAKPVTLSISSWISALVNSTALSSSKEQMSFFSAIDI